MKSNLASPLQHRALAFLVLLLLALVTLGGLIWRNLHHFNAVLSHVNYSHNVQNVSVELQQTLIEYLTEAVPVAYPGQLQKTMTGLHKTINEMNDLRINDSDLSQESRLNMDQVAVLLNDIDGLDKVAKNNRLLEALTLLSVVLDKEVIARDHLLEKISHDTENELYLASFTLVVILLLAGLFFHRRILNPLNDLKQLLQRLTEESYIPFATDRLDPLIQPVFKSYNDMVLHLAELEEANRCHAQSLQSEVRLATQALLEQQHSLARAERLAAIGEVAAELAHEIRNPLAGIQMAFSNLRREITDVQQCERMELIASELKRLAKLLNDMLDQSRHSPEQVSRFDLGILVRDLVTLTRYQLPENIQIMTKIPDALILSLPESGLRQVLLNLLLNAADALNEQAGQVCIQVTKDELGVRIDVLDDGPGFSADMLANGIRPFRTSRPRGNGLGLSMVQRFVKDVGGSIKLANQARGGAQVFILLPLSCVAGAVA